MKRAGLFHHQRHQAPFYQRPHTMWAHVYDAIFSKFVSVYFISFPKSGRSWIRTMLGKALCEKHGLPERMIPQTFKLTRRAGIEATLFTHETDLSFLRPSKYQDKKVVLLTRNIKDVLVSLYFHATRRVHLFQGEITDFLWGKKSPLFRYLMFHNFWYEHQDVPAGFLHITYEDFHTNPEENLKKVLAFIGASPMAEDIIQQAVEYGSFENMKQRERQGMIKDPRFLPGDPNDPQSYKTREGQTGGYTKYLSPDDIQLIDQLVCKVNNPFVQA